MISLLYKCNQTKERNNWDSTDKQECVRWRIPSRGKKKNKQTVGSQDQTSLVILVQRVQARVGAGAEVAESAVNKLE